MGKLIACSGRKRHGKDLCADIIIGLMSTIGNTTYEKRKFGDKVKEVCAVLTGVPADQWETTEQKNTLLGEEWAYYVDSPACDGTMELVIPTRRQFMTRLGTDAMTTHFHPLSWINPTFNGYNDESDWIIPDVRFTQEIDAVKNRGGIIIRVFNPRIPDDGDKHGSEASLDNYQGWDYYILNDGTPADLLFKLLEILIKEKLL